MPVEMSVPDARTRVSGCRARSGTASIEAITLPHGDWQRACNEVHSHRSLGDLAAAKVIQTRRPGTNLWIMHSYGFDSLPFVAAGGLELACGVFLAVAFPEKRFASACVEALNPRKNPVPVRMKWESTGGSPESVYA